MAAMLAAEREEAQALDREDGLLAFRGQFAIPTVAQLQDDSLAASSSTSTTPTPGDGADRSPRCVYLCGNSLGVQPVRTAVRIQQHLRTWAAQGVLGHFRPLRDSPLPTWLDADARAAAMMAPIVGAAVSEVAIMQTLTANLHFLLAAFYRPDAAGRHKILLESKAFPSDHYAVETQIRHHGLAVATSMVTIGDLESNDNAVLTTDTVLAALAEHAATTAILLLPGIQYYTGALLDIPTITRAAHEHGVFVIWDLAHAAGNVPLRLHDWDVDAAVWCSYKYLNSGPGGIGGLFVHSRHSEVPGSRRTSVATSASTATATATSASTATATATATPTPDPATTTAAEQQPDYRNRLAGWWGNDKTTRFAMAPQFRPVSGAAGFQLSNPSILDITSLCASLELFQAAGGMAVLRAKSLRLTAFLERLLRTGPTAAARAKFRILTPADPAQRGAQLSLLLADGVSLDGVMAALLARAVVVDDRKPSVVRVAPVPLYNTFEDCVDFVVAFQEALDEVGSTA